jgi:hypothetical protein
MKEGAANSTTLYKYEELEWLCFYIIKNWLYYHISKFIYYI